MKAKLILSFILSFAFYLLNSQIPQGFNYQALARDGTTGNPITTSISVRITVQSDQSGGTVFWVELHDPVVPNSSGLFNLVIGNGTRQSGLAYFSDIDWGVTPKYVKTEIFYQGQWKDMGASKLWTVPYSAVAGNIKGTLKNLSVKGEAAGPEEALFEVKNNNGQTIFAVYNEGVRIYVSDQQKGAKGGFAIGGFGTEKGGTSQRYLYVDADSIRGYIYNDPLVKGAKGGFAIGGFDASKSYKKDYLVISPDSARIYVNNRPSTKGAKGGFAIGGFDESKGSTSKLLTVSIDSIRMYIDDSAKGAKGGFAIGGYDASKGIPSPKYISVNANQTNIQGTDSLKGFSVTNIQGGSNSDYFNINKINYSIGHESGLKTNPNLSLTKGKYNVFLGYKSGFNNIEGYGNIFLGHESGFNTTTGSYNVYMGFRSGNANLNGNSNVFVGYQSGEKSTAGWNLYVGQGAGKENSTGTRNTYLGCQAGIDDGKYLIQYGVPPGSDNTYIGYRAGAANAGGSSNVYIGSYAGQNNNNNSSGRIFIGPHAGENVTTDNRLFIDISNTATPLIYGEFNATVSSRQLTINGKTTTNGSLNYGADVTATDDYVVSIPGITQYVAGMMITFKANTANTTACSVNVNSLGAIGLKMKHDQDPTTNYIEAGSIVMAVYDGTFFQMMQPAAN
jgi:hypothetical protein